MALLIFTPVFEKSGISKEFLAAIISLIFLSGVYTVLHESRGLFIAALALVAINFLTLWWEYAFWSTAAALVHCIGLLMFFLLIILIIFRQIARETTINLNVIYGE